jgi:hypothetical protein
VTSRLAQQLSLALLPQLLRPAPASAGAPWQLVPATALHAPSRQYGVEAEHAVPFCQVPVELHVCGCVLDPHCV